jgi:predicted metal-binding membrane protein
MSILKSLLIRDRLVVIASLCAMCFLAWWWLLHSEGQGARISGMAMPAAISIREAIATFLMWLNMMVAMMLPSAAPMILIYERVSENTRKSDGALMPTGLFATLYLAVWAGFSLLATIAQLLLANAALLDRMNLTFGDSRLSGAVLIAAALYQLTPAKRACLDNCRSPLDFLRREWGPGWGNVVKLGLKHGAYCVGCCWLILLLLFVGGVMNLAWVAALTLIVLAEKLAPAPEFTRKAIAAAAGLAGAYLLFR